MNNHTHLFHSQLSLPPLACIYFHNYKLLYNHQKCLNRSLTSQESFHIAAASNHSPQASTTASCWLAFASKPPQGEVVPNCYANQWPSQGFVLHSVDLVIHMMQNLPNQFLPFSTCAAGAAQGWEALAALGMHGWKALAALVALFV